MTDKAIRGTKSDSEKVRVELLPDIALFEVAKVLTDGAKRYDAYNWYKGIEYTRLLGAAKRHIMAFSMGEDYDESGRCHLSHAICELLFVLTFFIERRHDIDDRERSRIPSELVGEVFNQVRNMGS